MGAWGIVPETEMRPSPNSRDKYKHMAEGRNEFGFTHEFHFSHVFFFKNKDRLLPSASPILCIGHSGGKPHLS